VTEQRENESRCEKKKGAAHVAWGIAIVAAFIFLFGMFVQLLWNQVMPAVFGLRTITYLQAVGLLLLSRLLFGGMGQRRDHAGYLTGKYGFRSLVKPGSAQDEPGQCAD
jgi:hypothetical protein